MVLNEANSIQAVLSTSSVQPTGLKIRVRHVYLAPAMPLGLRANTDLWLWPIMFNKASCNWSILMRLFSLQAGSSSWPRPRDASTSRAEAKAWCSQPLLPQSMLGATRVRGQDNYTNFPVHGLHHHVSQAALLCEQNSQVLLSAFTTSFLLLPSKVLCWQAAASQTFRYVTPYSSLTHRKENSSGKHTHLRAGCLRFTERHLISQ